MSILQAIILGIIQGLCEFLPVSSSGHLVLVQQIFGIDEGAMFFDIMLHVATLLAVAYHFRVTLLKMFKRPFSKYPMMIVLSTVPLVVVALLFNDTIDELFSGSFLCFAFLLTSILLFLSSRISHQQKTLRDITPAHALIMGGAQGIAVIPGLSRSGTTISTGLFLGMEREFAAEYSFLMSIPAILGSLVLEIYKIINGSASLGNISIMPTLIGMIFAGISGLFAIRVMIRIIKKGHLKGFAIYTGILGILVFIDQFFTHIFL